MVTARRNTLIAPLVALDSGQLCRAHRLELAVPILDDMLPVRPFGDLELGRHLERTRSG